MQGSSDVWAASWEQLGTRVDDDAAVSIRVGVMPVGNDYSVALSIASGPPVVFSDHTASELAELMAWATEEREMLLDLRERERTNDAKTLLNRAILTRRQWLTIRRAVSDASGEHSGAATSALNDCAPPAWLAEHAD